MKTLVIENEFLIPKEIKTFIEANKNLEPVDYQVAVLHRPIGDIGKFIMESDIIILQSSWMYRAQLEAFIEEFANGKFSFKTYKFFIKNGFQFFKQCIEKTETSHGFANLDRLNANLLKIISESEVYEIVGTSAKQILLENNTLILKA